MRRKGKDNLRIICFLLGHKKFGKTVIKGNFVCDRCDKRIVLY